MGCLEGAAADWITGSPLQPIWGSDGQVAAQRLKAGGSLEPRAISVAQGSQSVAEMRCFLQ